MRQMMNQKWRCLSSREEALPGGFDLQRFAGKVPLRTSKKRLEAHLYRFSAHPLLAY